MKIDISPGEVWDRWTILTVKLEKSASGSGREALMDELCILNPCLPHEAVGEIPNLLRANRENFEAIEVICQILKADDIDSEYGNPVFVVAVRAAFAANARRALIKRRINEACGWTGPSEVKTDAVLAVADG